AGLTKARQEIQALVEGGMSHSDALIQVKSKYYEDLGALAIRGQLYDTYFHVLGDPINYIFPAIKPVENIKKLSYFAGATKWADETISIGKEAIDAARLVGKAGTKFDEVVDIGLRSKKIIGDDLLKFNKAAEAGDVTTVTKMAEKALKDVGLTTREKAALWITGGKDPFKVAKTPLGKLYDKAPWRLTPESRAYEYVTVIQDNVGKYVVEGLDDPYAIYDTIKRAAAGAVGPELGHAFMTVEGRAVQGALKGFEAEVAKLLSNFDRLSDERMILATIADAAKKTPEELMGMMKQGDFTTVAKYADMTKDQLGVLFKKLDGMPFSKKIFKYQTMSGLADWTAKQGALMFGVKQRGFVQKMAQAVKSAETLAFLRINPGYMIRNVLNNEVTMIARGAGISWDDLKKAGDYFDLDMEPFRFGQGFGAAGDVYAVAGGKGAAKVAGEALNEILRGKEGKLDKFTNWVSSKRP
ncbi:MAG: hypothetical protein KAI94_00700, partial [Anaerolineales bacterium]|nr:hypothetical protein [Anaerolineales bacterium]